MLFCPSTMQDTITNNQHLVVQAHRWTTGRIGNGLTHSILAPAIRKSDVFTCFGLINRCMAKKLIDKGNEIKLKSFLSHLAHSYVNSYRPTAKDLKKFCILKYLKKNKNIVILTGGDPEILKGGGHLTDLPFEGGAPFRFWCLVKVYFKK